MRIKKGDTVYIRSGKDGGKTGKVLRVDSSAGTVLVEGLNMYKKRSRPRKQGEKGEMINLPRPLNASKVMPYCSSCGRGVRVGFRSDGKVSTVRYCKRCQSVL
jgi:large subunit ribosomal protein L24